MSTYTIGDTSHRSGFSASALRYYDAIGLVTPAGRSPAGYRVYDDHALARLAFIRRAKRLGCSLEEIFDLAAVWGASQCGPVQRRLHHLVTDKIDRAEREAAEHAAFAGQLRMAAEQLNGEPIDGPCDDGCACLTATPRTRPGAFAPSNACTLEPEALPDRIAAWRAVLDVARSRTATADGGLRVEFDDDIDLATLARLVAAEQRCCAFFSFVITVDLRGIALEVEATIGGADAVASLFGGTAVMPTRMPERIGLQPR